MKKNNKNGISLITLIITILVVLIISGVVILNVINRDTLKSVKESVFKNDLKSFDEQIRTAILSDFITDASVVEKTFIEKDEIKQYSPELVKSKYKDIAYISEGVLTLKSGKLTEEQIKWAKEAHIKLDSTVNIENNTNVEINVLPIEWTNEDVLVALNSNNISEEYDISEYKLQYKIDENEWCDYITPLTVTQNCVVYGRLLYIPTLDDEIGGNSNFITNIDKTAPTEPSISVEQALNNITVTASGSTDEGSGLKGYKYSIDGNKWSEVITSGTSYEFSGIKANTDVTIWVKAVDNVLLESNIVKSNTETLTINDTVKITPSTTEWINGNVICTLSYSTVPSDYKIQYKVENGNWTTGTTIVITENTTVYGRLYNSTLDDEIGGSSNIITNIDKTAPSKTTVIYNSGANTCTWKNNYNITFSAIDYESGILKYQIDSNQDGIADYETDKNYVPLNGHTTCTERYRAVDIVGNVGEWTDLHHTHMDTENPIYLESWWGEVTLNVAKLYIKATDNVEIGKVEALTSTKSGSNNNWVTFNAVWDSSVNAYRAYIKPSTFGHYGELYTVHIHIYDKAGNSGNYNVTTVNIPDKNSAPSVPEIGLNNRNTNNFTVDAQATDPDGNNLVYKLYVKKSSDTAYTLANTSQSTTSGAKVTLTASNLTSYTVYNYYVTVTDTKNATNNSTTSTTGTACSGTGSICKNSESNYTVSSGNCSGNEYHTCSTSGSSPACIGYTCSVCGEIYQPVTRYCKYHGYLGPYSNGHLWGCPYHSDTLPTCTKKIYTCSGHGTCSGNICTVSSTTDNIHQCSPNYTCMDATLTGTRSFHPSGAPDNVSVTIGIFTCSKHNVTYESGGTTSGDTSSITNSGHSAACGHGISSTHYYCSKHSYVGTSSQHNYCVHGKVGMHYPN